MRKEERSDGFNPDRRAKNGYETGGEEEGKWNKMMMCLLLLLWFGDIISGVTFLFLLASVKTNAAAELSQGRVAAATGLAGKKTKK